MICKNDVIVWFKELESYRRIDTMCTLLNMCLPFELRFLGTCLEELGRRDSQELRGMELRANNPQDLATDMIACQKGEPTDKKIRRKMALYLALIRACNRTCVSEIFRTLEGWGDRDFSTLNDTDTLQELLLVYTMAANHPVFSFEQHLKCTEIFEKIKQNKLVCDTVPTSTTPIPSQRTILPPVQMDTAIPAGVLQQQKDIRHLPQSHQEILPQHALHALHLSGQHHQILGTGPIQVLSQGTMPLNFPQGHLTKIISDGNLQHHLTVDSLPHMISSNISSIPAESNILAHANSSWALRSFPPAGPLLEHPPQATSPMLSQQSSPSSSRAGSPNRASTNVMSQSISNQANQQTSQQQQQQQQQNVRRMNISMKNMRRPSVETTPPPMSQQQQHQHQHQQQQQQQHQHQQQILSSDIILPQNMKHVDEVINIDGSGNQLQNLIRNGFRTGQNSRQKSGYQQQQHQQQQSPINHQYQMIASGNIGLNPHQLAYSVQSMSLNDAGNTVSTNMDSGGMVTMNSNKSTASDSSSSIGSSGEISPPETPTMLQMNATNSGGSGGGGLRMTGELTQKHHQHSHNYKQMNMSRLNGRSEKIPVSGVSSGSGSAGGSNIYVPAPTVSNTHQVHAQQSQPPHFGSDMLASGTSTGTVATNMMQTTVQTNNNSNASNNAVNAITNSCSNNNMPANTVIISSPTATGNLIGNVITSNSLLLQSQQYNNTYPYHAAGAAVTQHPIAHSPRPAIIGHNHQGMAPPPQPGTYRLPSFQLPPNGELIYQTYHPGLTFLSSGAPPPPQMALRSTNTSSVNTPNICVPPPQLAPQGPVSTAQGLQTSSQAVIPNAALLTSPYTTLTVGIAKPISCYNCGSQAHVGRDCMEASMDDVTRSANYKLDYSISAATTTSPPATGTGTNIGSSNSGNVSNTTGNTNPAVNPELTHQILKQQTADIGGSSAATSPNMITVQSSSTSPATANTIITK